MEFSAPFVLPVYWKSEVPWVGGYNIEFNRNRADGTILVDRQLSFDEFVRRANKICRADLRVKKMSFTLVWSDEDNVRRYAYFDDDEDLCVIYLYGLKKSELYVSLRERTPEPVDLGRSSQGVGVVGRSLDVGGTSGFFTCSDVEFTRRCGGGSQSVMDFNPSQYERFERGEGSTRAMVRLNESPYDDEGDDDVGHDVMGESSEDIDDGESGEEMFSSDTSADESYQPTDSEDEIINVPDDHHVYGDIGNDPDNDDEFEGDSGRWDGNTESISVDTIFKSKEAVQNAIALWSARKGVNYRTVESKSTTWAVECVTRAPNYPQEMLHGVICPWSIRASKQRWSGKWKMVRWVGRHTCAGAGSSSRNITQKQIAALVIPHVKTDLGYKVKSVQTLVE
jgi:hypothetical protein